MKIRRLARWLSLLVIMSAIVLPLSQRGTPVAQEEANVHFRWAFGALVSGENPPRLIAITQDTAKHADLRAQSAALRQGPLAERVDRFNALLRRRMIEPEEAADGLLPFKPRK